MVAIFTIAFLYFAGPSLMRSGGPMLRSLPPEPKNVFTLHQYNRIREGMSYTEVSSILGGAGVENASNRIDAVPGVINSINAKLYSWTNQDGSNMNAIFQNGKLVQKAQFGLK